MAEEMKPTKILTKRNRHSTSCENNIRRIGSMDTKKKKELPSVWKTDGKEGKNRKIMAAWTYQ